MISIKLSEEDIRVNKRCAEAEDRAVQASREQDKVEQEVIELKRELLEALRKIVVLENKIDSKGPNIVYIVSIHGEKRDEITAVFRNPNDSNEFCDTYNKVHGEDIEHGARTTPAGALRFPVIEFVEHLSEK